MAHDSPEFAKKNPDAGIGFLSAAFIGGYSVAIIISSHMVHKIRWKKLLVVGLIIWIVAVFGSGLAYYANSFWLLFFSRMVSGVSEASFHVVAPPMIQDRGGAHAGLWLAWYLSAIPVGLAFGYIYSSHISNAPGLGWQWAYFFECLFAIPLLLQISCLNDEENDGMLSKKDHLAKLDRLESQEYLNRESERALGSQMVPTSLEDDDDNTEAGEKATILTRVDPQNTQPLMSVTIKEEIKACLSSEILIYVSLAQAVFTSVTVALGTFGGAFILALELFETEEGAATTFGIAAALAGVIGTPLGGLMVDKVQALVGIHASAAEELTYLLPRINLCVIIGVLFCWPTCLATGPATFIGFIFFGWLFLFIGQSGIQWSIMLSVDEQHRPNALAFAMFNSHLLGDVPFPVVFGALKDYLAPACNINANGVFVDVDECRNQRGGIRGALAFAYAYMTFAIIFFEIARRYAMEKYLQVSHEEGLRRKGDIDEVA